MDPNWINVVLTAASLAVAVFALFKSNKAEQAVNTVNSRMNLFFNPVKGKAGDGGPGGSIGPGGVGVGGGGGAGGGINFTLPSTPPHDK